MGEHYLERIEIERHHFPFGNGEVALDVATAHCNCGHTCSPEQMDDHLNAADIEEVMAAVREALRAVREPEAA